MKDFNRLWPPANNRTLQQYMQSCQLSAMVNKDFTHNKITICQNINDGQA